MKPLLAAAIAQLGPVTLTLLCRCLARTPWDNRETQIQATYSARVAGKASP